MFLQTKELGKSIRPFFHLLRYFERAGPGHVATSPRPLQVRHGKPLSGVAPVPRQSGHFAALADSAVTEPLPPQTVQVRRWHGYTPLPWQKTHVITGSASITARLPIHTWQADAAESKPNGSLPVPSQKPQVMVLMFIVELQ
ncbi:MAG: hypothetical protein NTV22_11535 [bacterium]|nr:hypothetical protein [bacterium]